MKSRGPALAVYGWIVLIVAAACVGGIVYEFVSVWLS